jgi:hypothetical protein
MTEHDTTSAMIVIVNKQRMFRTEFLGILMIHLHTNFYMPAPFIPLLRYFHYTKTYIQSDSKLLSGTPWPIIF